jgi:hypothetical protein
MGLRAKGRTVLAVEQHTCGGTGGIQEQVL